MPWCWPDERAEGCGDARGAGEKAEGRRRRGGATAEGREPLSAAPFWPAAARSEPVGKARRLAPVREHLAVLPALQSVRQRVSEVDGQGWARQGASGIRMGLSR